MLPWLPMSGSGVIILFGGTSNERRVSVASAQHIAAVLDEAEAWFLAPTGAVHPVTRDVLAHSGVIVGQPVAGGSSVGLYHVGSAPDADRAASGIEESGEAYLAEEFVSGTELTVGVVDGPAGSRALPPSEVRLEQGRAFDYEGKYLGKGTKEITPAEVPPAVSRAAQDLALTAHRALGCEGYSPTDAISSPQGPVFLELNTLPGLTRASFLPQQLAVEGTSMLSFLEGQLAIARNRRDRG